MPQLHAPFCQVCCRFVARDDVEEREQTKSSQRDKVISKQTNLKNSKHTVWLHTESNGGVPHLHVAVCRVDEDVNINNDHQIHLRAQRATEQVAIRRGWITAAQVRTANIHLLNFNLLWKIFGWSIGVITIGIGVVIIVSKLLKQQYP